MRAGPTHRFMVVVAIAAPGAEHHIAWAQVAADEFGHLRLLFAQSVVSETTAHPFQAVHWQAETAQGLDAFLRAEHAQAFFRPLPRTRVAGAAIGDREQLQRMTEAGE
ncbi:hypothetical protein D3C81_1699170 [compost metagenome]